MCDKQYTAHRGEMAAAAVKTAVKTAVYTVASVGWVLGNYWARRGELAVCIEWICCGPLRLAAVYGTAPNIIN